MNDRNEIPNTIYALTEKLLNGTLSDEGVRTLERELRGNPDYQQFFQRYCRIHANLAMNLRAEQVLDDFRKQHDDTKATTASSATGKSASSTPVVGALNAGTPNAGTPEGSTRIPGYIEGLGQPADGHAPGSVAFSNALPFLSEPTAARWPWFVTGSLLGVVLTTALLLWPRPLDPTAALDALTATAPAAALDTPIAFLRTSNGCEWGSDGPPLDAIGSSVRSGDEITLNQGIAEFTLASGVTLSIEGPASLLITSPSALALQYGRLTAYVPWTVTNFKAFAAGCRLTACDAEFGVCVEGANADIHVFSGEVRAVTSLASDVPDVQKFDEAGSVLSDDAGAFVKGVITAGRALSLTSKGKSLNVERWGQAAPSKFAAKLSMAGRLPITKAYIDAVLESRPLAYWRFESLENDRIPNLAPPRGDSGPGPEGGSLKVVGTLRKTGHTDNYVAEFQPASGSYLESSDPLKSLAKSNYSLEVWVKPSHIHRGTLLLLFSDGPPNPFGSGLELQGTAKESVGFKHSGAVRYVHHNPVEGGNPRVGTSCLSKKPYDARRWQHVVAVKEGTQMRLYIDGVLAGSASESKQLAAGLRAIVGRNCDAGTRNRDFVGQLDEMAIYNRALTEEEIQSHYRAVHWTPDQQADARESIH